MDHFKALNDQYGRHAGDLALKAFANMRQREIRESDISGRMGGGESGLKSPEITLQHAQMVAERIRKAGTALGSTSDDQTIVITVSIGPAEPSTEDATLDSVMRRADLAPYTRPKREAAIK